MVARLVLVLGDQLSADLSALRAGDRARDVVVMAEVASEAEYVRHHPKKIALIFAAMRKFSGQLRADGWDVRYTTLDDPDNAGSIPGELLRRAGETGAGAVLATEPGEWRLIGALRDTPLDMTLLPDDRFIASHGDFETWAKGRKALRMEYFYRDMRKRTGLMMEGDKPAGDKWNYDHDNRKPARLDAPPEGPLGFTPDAVTQEVLALVEARFGSNFGDLHPFSFATTRAEALAALDHFVAHALPTFGDYQDAMVRDEPYLFHAVLSPYLNIGLLGPLEVCQAVEKAWQDGHAPINAAEGFIRQIIGWREYVRGIYFLEGPDYSARNGLGQTRDLPDFYWGKQTHMACVSQAVAQTEKHAYADAFEWVEAPNVVGMSQFADGGIIASKPYVSSGAYINRMSDYCKGCAYKVSVKTGPGACPFNLLYWHFLDRHRDRFEGNARMGNMYRTWDRMDGDRRETVLRDAQSWLDRLDAGEVV